MPDDDRDREAPKHPRLGDTGDWDEDSGVEHRALPVSARASTQSGHSSNNSARAAFRKIDELGKKFDAHAQADKEALDHISSKIEAHAETLTQARIDAAATRAAVENMTDELRHQRDIHKIEVQGEVTAKVEKQKIERERMSGRTKILLALVAVLSTLVGGFVKWLVS